MDIQCELTESLNGETLLFSPSVFLILLSLTAFLLPSGKQLLTALKGRDKK